MKNRFTSLISITLVLSLVSPVKTQANPAAALAPAICATGIGCVLLGTVVIGGIAYYVWQNNETGEKYQLPIRDPEEESQSMGSPQTETVIAGTQSTAEKLCRELAEQRGLTMQKVDHHSGNQWNCIMY